ncbi:response regulator [Sphingomonas parva]|uniref:Response regulator n=1 Tax=Sphingomonas parva TaxID=2555898 RepID=A0A4Y8ZQ15_9SPHN|nr:response regulator [Sphingomonas parva]TFI58093.1 response regulator [Sphingomonas parva]
MIPASAIRIMIVDDDSGMRRLIRRSLQHVGLTQVFEARDGLEALTRVLEERIHIVICDYSMPVMNGLDLLEAIRNDPKLSKVGFIMLSGVTENDVIRKAEALGVNGYIIKPFSLVDLQQRLDALFHKLNGRNIEWRMAS